MRCWMASALTALCLLSCAGCGTHLADAPLPLDELPGDYTLAQAKEDDCVVFEDCRVTSGQGLWDAFVEASSRGKAANVRLCRCGALGSERGSPAPRQAQCGDADLFLIDLSYDGAEYTVRSFEDGQEIVKTYPYMMHYMGRADTPDAAYASYIRYVLTRDDSVTWEDIMAGRLSSQAGQAIDCYPVYEELR